MPTNTVKSRKRKSKARVSNVSVSRIESNAATTIDSSRPSLEFLKACQYHQAGRLNEARSCYERSIEQEPTHVDSWRNLGGLMRQLGMAGDALRCAEKAISLRKEDAGLWGNAGNALRDLGRLEESEQAFRKAIKIEPANLGQILGLAITLNKGKRHWDVIQLTNLIRDVTLTNSGALADIWLEIGNAYHCLQNKQEALKHWQWAVEACASDKQLMMVLNIAQVLCETGRYTDAEKMLCGQLREHPSNANLHYALGVCNKGIGQWERAVEWFEKSLSLDPTYTICLNTYGLLLRDIGRIHQARKCFEKALEIDGEFGAAMNNLGSVLKDVCRYEEALSWLRKSAESMKTNPAAHSNVLFTLFGYELESKEKRLKEAESFGKLYSNAPHERWKDRLLAPDPQRRLRIGFVSPDFCRHAVSYFIEPILEQLDKKKIHTTLYACGSVRDDYTARLQKKCDQWRDIHGSTLENCILQILRDEIDILIDLAGHTAGNRLDLMCCKPAPIQATYLGYYGTTGCNNIDYWLSDEVLHPTNGEDSDPSVETKWRLKRPYICYRPLPEAGSVTSTPAMENGYITFGSFNQSRKITKTTASRWMKVLSAVPNSKLLLKSKNLSESAESERIQEMFSELGLCSDRLILYGHSPSVAAHLEAYSRMDVGLDTFPYTGCTTTADALWMGVPVLTVSGSTMVSRQAAAVLTAANCSEWICETDDELVNKAIRLVTNVKELNQIRQHLRIKVSNSPLLDHREMANHLEDTFQTWWSDWLKSKHWTHQETSKNKAWPEIKPRANLPTKTPYPR